MMPSGTASSLPGKSWREPAEISLQPILQAALEVFHQYGFHGTSVRQIAEAAGVTVPTLYYHHRNKEGMLSALLGIGMADLLERVEQALEEAGDDSIQQLANIIYAGVLHTTTRSELAGLHSESRYLSLGAPGLLEYRASRRRFEEILKTTVLRGRGEGAFRSDGDVDDLARFLLGAVQSIPTWYRRAGRRSPQALAEEYVRIALNSVDAAA